MSEKLTILDTTLRDGEQSVGASMNTAEKIRLARQLEKLGVDIMEVGFPSASKGEFEAVSEIAGKIRNTELCVLARSTKGDIDASWGALQHAARARIQTFVSSSDIHIKYKLNMTRDEVLKMAVEGVRYASTKFDYVQFGVEDGSRSDRDYLCKLFEAAIEAGAQTVNLADTVGYVYPEEFAELIKYIIGHTPNIHKAILGVHCHDDLGLATANTLAGIAAGARHAEVTLNGIGERAGNASLEEVVMALNTRPDILGLSTQIKLDQILATSRLVSMITGIPVQPNKAIVGANAFSHESGIHQHGVLKNPLTYQIMKPETIGFSSNRLVLGKHSGKHGLRSRLEELGFDLNDEELSLVFTKFKELADMKKNVFDDDLEVVVAESLMRTADVFRLEHLHVTSGESGSPTVNISLSINGKSTKALGSGSGPVNAIYNTLAEMTATETELESFSVNALTDGSDAQVEATVRLSINGLRALGRAADSDVLTACARAYINGLNRLEYLKVNPILHTGEK